MSDDQYGDYSRRGDHEGQDPYGQDPYAGRRHRTRGAEPSYPARGEEPYPPAGGRGDTAYPRSYGRDYSGRGGEYGAADGAGGTPADDYHTGGYASGYPAAGEYGGAQDSAASPREQRSYRRGEYRPRGEYGRRGADPYGGETRSRRDVLGVIASSLFAVLAVLALVTVLWLIFRPSGETTPVAGDDPSTDPSAASGGATDESTETEEAPPAEEAKAPVVVLNATGINGLAASVTEEIGGEDWETREPGNYQEGVVEETTVFYPNEDLRPAAESLKAAFSNITAIEQADETMAQDALTVVLAAEWD